MLNNHLSLILNDDLSPVGGSSIGWRESFRSSDLAAELLSMSTGRPRFREILRMISNLEPLPDYTFRKKVLKEMYTKFKTEYERAIKKADLCVISGGKPSDAGVNQLRANMRAYDQRQKKLSRR